MGLTRTSTGKKRVSMDSIHPIPGTDGICALAGNPNVGKSSVFNALTGLHQHTGNWPGKTVELATGQIRCGEKRLTLVDLPGTYSLSADSPEEEIAGDCICFGAIDRVIVVCDATNMERNLYLTLQILSVMRRAIVCVNLMDEADRRGLRLDLKRLEQWLEVPVIGVSARKKTTVQSLKDILEKEKLSVPEGDGRPDLWDERIQTCVDPLKQILEQRFSTGRISLDWLAYEILLQQPKTMGKISRWCGEDLSADGEIREARARCREQLLRRGIRDIETAEQIQALYLLSLARRISGDIITSSPADPDRRDRAIDRVLTGRWVGYPLMLLLLSLVFWITIRGADYPTRLLSAGLFWLGDRLSEGLMLLHTPPWLHDMLILGVYRVLAWVVSVMLPPMAIFFPLFTILEDIGYLPRVAFNLDRPFQRCRSCGKQALTMAMGFGCNAAGVVGCRIIQSEKERTLAAVTNSLVPCNGRFPILIVMLGILFSGKPVITALGLTLLVFLSVMITFLTTRLLADTVCKGAGSPFLMELPPYRLPDFGQVVVRSLLDRTLFVLGRAAAVAAPAGFLLWLLANAPAGDTTILHQIAAALDPIGRFLGMDGVILLAFILGFPANETVIPIALMIYLSQGSLGSAMQAGDIQRILAENGWTWATVCSVILFTMFHWPCSTTLLTIKKETGKWRYVLLSAAVPTLCGTVLCALFHAVVRFLA